MVYIRKAKWLILKRWWIFLSIWATGCKRRFKKATDVTAGLLHDGSLLANQSIDTWSTGHLDQMEVKINVAQ